MAACTVFKTCGNIPYAKPGLKTLVQQVHELESAVRSGFQCRVDGCNKIYIHHSTRIKYAKFKIYLLCFQQIPYVKNRKKL